MFLLIIIFDKNDNLKQLSANQNIFKKTIAMVKNLLFVPFLLLYCFVFSQAPTCAWATKAGGHLTDIAETVISDQNGNIIVLGEFSDSTITFGTYTLFNSHYPNFDIYIVKYAATGNVIGAKSEGGFGNDYCTSAQTDGSGNVYITGSYDSPDITFGNTTLTNSGAINIFLVKYDPQGNVIWAQTTNGTDVDEFPELTVDPNGNVYMSGSFYSPSLTFGSDTIQNSNLFFADVFVAKFNTAGTVLWANSSNGLNTEFDQGIDCDNSGNCYVTGYFYGQSVSFDTITLTNADTSGYNLDPFLVKYNSDGFVEWAKNIGGFNMDAGTAVACDGNGNVYHTGYFQSPSITVGSSTLSNNGSNISGDIFLVKYDSSGTAIWARSIGGTDHDHSLCLTIDASGNTFIGGYFYSPVINAGSSILSITPGSGYRPDMLILKFDASGNPVWGKSVEGNRNDAVVSSALDVNGDFYFIGEFQSHTLTLDNFTVTNASIDTSDILIAKLDLQTNTQQVYPEKLLVNVFPNPATDLLHVMCYSVIDEIEIRDLPGHLIYQNKLQSKEIIIPIKQNGVLIAVIKSEGKEYRKLIFAVGN